MHAEFDKSVGNAVIIIHVAFLQLLALPQSRKKNFFNVVLITIFVRNELKYNA